MKHTLQFELKSSSNTNWSYHISNIINDDSQIFHSFNQKYSWFQFKFPNKEIYLTSYHFKPSIFKKIQSFPKNWILLGYNKEKKWFCIDEIINFNYNNNFNKIKKFKCYCKYLISKFKFIQTSKNSLGDYCLSLSYFNFEFQ